MPGICMRAILFVLLLIVVAQQGLQAQPDRKTLDRIYILDPATKKEDDVYGKIEQESPVGLKVKVRKGKEDQLVTIPSSQILRVYYYTPDVLVTDYNRGFINEANWERATDKKKRAELFSKALDGFRDTERQLNVRPEAKRYLQYRIAMLLVNASKEDASKREEAIKALQQFTSGNRTSFTIVNALITQAQLLEEANRLDEARESYEALSRLPEVPPAVTRQGELLVGKMYLRLGKYAEAQKRFSALASKLNPNDADKPFVDVYLTESLIGQGKMDGAEKTLLAVLQASEDARLRALAHNLLGEWHLKKGKQEEAFWHFLRVDALYPEDAEEHSRALFHLATLFDKVKKDPNRADEAKRRLFGEAYKATRYQKIARESGMAPPEVPSESKGS